MRKWPVANIVNQGKEADIQGLSSGQKSPSNHTGSKIFSPHIRAHAMLPPVMGRPGENQKGKTHLSSLRQPAKIWIIQYRRYPVLINLADKRPRNPLVFHHLCLPEIVKVLGCVLALIIISRNPAFYTDV
jgi:hypothetical protein